MLRRDSPGGNGSVAGEEADVDDPLIRAGDDPEDPPRTLEHG
jgi:hypothetical protein